MEQELEMWQGQRQEHADSDSEESSWMKQGT